MINLPTQQAVYHHSAVNNRVWLYYCLLLRIFEY